MVTSRSQKGSGVGRQREGRGMAQTEGRGDSVRGKEVVGPRGRKEGRGVREREVG